MLPIFEDSRQPFREPAFAAAFIAPAKIRIDAREEDAKRNRQKGPGRNERRQKVGGIGNQATGFKDE